MQTERLNDYDLYCKLHNESVEISNTMNQEGMTYVLSIDEIVPEKRAHAKQLEARKNKLECMKRLLEKRNGWISSFVCKDDGCVYLATNNQHPYGSGHIVLL